MTETIDKDAIFTLKGETHYVWPRRYENGNGTSCGDCRYFVPNAEQPRMTKGRGECHSICAHTERGYTHRTNGWDFAAAGDAACHWWFPVESQPGEQAELTEVTV